ncbi:MAG: GNAT family protein, partial [Allosphingosinicella sp.]
LRRLDAGHFLDNPASGRVLEKLGFEPTGRIVPYYSAGRGEAAPCRLFRLELDREGDVAQEAMAA